MAEPGTELVVTRLMGVDYRGIHVIKVYGEIRSGPHEGLRVGLPVDDDQAFELVEGWVRKPRPEPGKQKGGKRDDEEGAGSCFFSTKPQASR